MIFTYRDYFVSYWDTDLDFNQVTYSRAFEVKDDSAGAHNQWWLDIDHFSRQVLFDAVEGALSCST